MGRKWATEAKVAAAEDSFRRVEKCESPVLPSGGDGEGPDYRDNPGVLGGGSSPRLLNF